MTLVLSCVTQKQAIQVSDRRLVAIPSGKLVDDESNKAVLFCGRMAVSYTGLAKLEGKTTDLWICDTLASARSISDAVYALRDRASSVFENIRLPIHLKRHAFVGVGWTRHSADEPYRAMICWISNALDDNLNWLDIPYPRFRARVNIMEPEDSLYFIPIGQPIPRGKSSQLLRILKEAARKNVGSGTLARILVENIRDIACDNDRIGKNLMVTSIPLETVGERFNYVVSSAPADNVQTFLYLPERRKSIQYGPNYVCGGMKMTNVQSGPLVR